MKHISIVVIPRALGSSVTIPLEMLSAANDVARARKQPGSLNQIELLGISKGKHLLAGELEIECSKSIADIEHTDLIFIPGVWRKPYQALLEHPRLVTWLKQHYARNATLCAAATGVYFVAQAGLLNGKPATTHWRYFDEFQKRFPQVKLQRKRFTTNSNNIYCTGSVNAIRDIMLHFIAELYDTSIADDIAQHFTHELKPSFTSQSLGKDQHSTHHDELIITIQEWLQKNFQAGIQIGDMSKNFDLSVRSLNRRFKQATNLTPLQYLQSLRLEHAKELLKHSNLVIAEIADKVGYQDTSYFTELFKKANRVTPHEYRQLVRNKLFVAEGNQPNS